MLLKCLKILSTTLLVLEIMVWSKESRNSRCFSWFLTSQFHCQMIKVREKPLKIFSRSETTCRRIEESSDPFLQEVRFSGKTVNFCDKCHKVVFSQIPGFVDLLNLCVEFQKIIEDLEHIRAAFSLWYFNLSSLSTLQNLKKGFSEAEFSAVSASKWLLNKPQGKIWHNIRKMMWFWKNFGPKSLKLRNLHK